MNYIYTNPPLFAEFILGAVLVLLFSWKVILYARNKSNSIEFPKIFYFSNYSIINSRNEESRHFKIIQNKLSSIIFLVLIPEVFLVLLNHVWLTN